LIVIVVTIYRRLPGRGRQSTVKDDNNHYETVDHGQVVKYLGDRPVETAKNGLQRVGSHSRYGFGELRLKPLGEQYQESEGKD